LPISSSLYPGKSDGIFTLFSCESLSVTVFPLPSVNFVISAIFVILVGIGSVETTLHTTFTSL